MEKEIFNYRWICARRRREAVTKQLLCQKTRRTTHACKDTYTHTNVGKVNKEEAEWKQECQNDVAEGDHSILTALTAHTHTHRQCTQAELTARDGRAR